MSTDHTAFDLAPSNGAATATRERTDTPTPTKPTSTTKTSKKKPTNPDAPHDTTLGGVLIPGGVITGLIALCWMTHQFGLGPVIFGLLACAAAASAALAVKTRNAIRKATGRKSGALRSAGGAGPGTRGVLGSSGSARNPSGALSSAGRTGSGTRSLGSSGRSSGGASMLSQGGRRSGSGFGMTGGAPKPTGPVSRKPAGFGSFAKTGPAAAGGSNSVPKQTGPALGKTAAATGGAGKPLGSGKSAGGKGLLGGGSKASGAGTSSGGKGGSRRGLLGRKGSMSGGGNLGASGSSTGNKKSSAGHKKSKNNGTGGGSPTGKAGAAAARGRLGAFLRRNSTTPAQPATAKGHDKKKPTPGTPTSPVTPKQAKDAKKAAKAAKNNKGHNGTTPKPGNLKAKTKPTTGAKKNKSKKPWKSPSTNRHRAPIGPARRGTYWVGKKLRKHTSRTTRLRIKKVVGPVRSAARNFNRFASPLLAHTVRFASRAILHSHMLLGTIRYTSAGPNWLRPFTRLLHVVTSPVARLVATSGSWRWMNSWIYRHTTPQPGTTGKAAPAQPTAPVAGPHRAVTSPAATTAGTSTKGSTTVSSIQHTMPLIYAAEAVRAAGVMLLVNPAENMIGYEATMRQLADVQHAIGQVVQAAGLSTQENFKVNPAVSDAYFDTAGYAHTVGERLGSIPDLFRIIHAEQIENIENPTPQAAKWDQSANNLAE
ncbi:hypothetical protein [Streptomyces nigrescens]|uniref:hypothetical protein n=1 Tax=Streptomyces nigrescens TaxID=1920 RepID=UPI0036802E86